MDSTCHFLRSKDTSTGLMHSCPTRVSHGYDTTLPTRFGHAYIFVQFFIVFLVLGHIVIDNDTLGHVSVTLGTVEHAKDKIKV